MAKHSRRSGKKKTKRPSGSLQPGSHSKPIAALVLGLLLVVGVIGLYALGPQVHWALYSLLGIVIVGLAVTAYVLATQPRETEEEVLVRLRRGQSADFGKRIRESAHQPRVVRLPAVGEVGLRTLGGVIVGVVTAVWWLTPLAPVGIRKLSIEDITSRMTDEIKAVVLAMADEAVMVPQPPVVPTRARELAQRITDASDAYQRALRATAEGHFDDARTLLSDSAGKDDVPAEKIRLAQAINEMYAAQFTDAAEHYQKLLLRDSRDPDLLCQAAVAWMQAGDFAKARPLIDRAVDACNTGQPETEPLLAAVLHARAVLLLAGGEDLDDAHAAATRSCSIWTETLGDDHPYAAASRNNQAAIYALQANHTSAQQLFQWAREGWTRTLGADHPNVATALANLALVDMALGEYSRARDGLDRGLSLRTTALGDAHPAIAVSYNSLARLDLAQGRHESARTTASRAVSLAQKVLGPSHSLVGAIADTVGAVETAQARHVKAEASYQRAADIHKQVFGAKHPCMVGTLYGLGELYLALGRLDRAEAVAERIEEISEKTFRKEHPDVAAALELRGRIELARNQPAEAKPYLEDALKILHKVFDDEHPDVARLLGYLALANHSADPTIYQRVVEQYRAAVTMAQKFFGAQHPEVARLWYGLARLHLMAGKFPEARSALDRSLAIQEKMLTTFHPELAATYSAYAELFTKGQPADPRRAAEMRRKAEEVLARYEQVNPASAR